MIKRTPKHRHLLGNERSQSRKEKVGLKPHVGDDENIPESHTRFNKILAANFKTFNLWVPRKMRRLLLDCFGVSPGQDIWKCAWRRPVGLQDPRDLKLGPSLPIPDKDALPAIAGLDWMCMSKVFLGWTQGCGGSALRGLWTGCVNDYKTFLKTVGRGSLWKANNDECLYVKNKTAGTWMGRKPEQQGIYVYTWPIRFAVENHTALWGHHTPTKINLKN